jgi:hypothetical protein
VLLVALVAGATSGVARATSQAWVAYATPPSGLLGARSNIVDPDTVKTVLYQYDFMLSSAYADDNSGPGNGVNLFQQGVTFEYNAPQAPDCSLGYP